MAARQNRLEEMELLSGLCESGMKAERGCVERELSRNGGCSNFDNQVWIKAVVALLGISSWICQHARASD